MTLSDLITRVESATGPAAAAYLKGFEDARRLAEEVCRTETKRLDAKARRQGHAGEHASARDSASASAQARKCADAIASLAFLRAARARQENDTP